MSSTYISSSSLSSSTPGFSFGRSGTINSGTYLQIDSVPSNKAGRIIPFTECELSYIFLSCGNDATFDIDVQTRTGNVYTTVYTASVTSSRVATFQVSDVEFNFGDEICVLVSNGSVSNLIVGLLIRGNGYG